MSRALGARLSRAAGALLLLRGGDLRKSMWEYLFQDLIGGPDGFRTSLSYAFGWAGWLAGL
ncbi:MAG TPA: hypothetical protein VGY53_13235, partial [Isosphaeraceae bacterium]|nr:hypothetical protein [Isosphaeraceae bacterium]